MFNRSFDSNQPDAPAEEVEEEVVEEEQEPEVVVPTFSEEELEAAKKEAFEKGREEALKESATAIEQQIVDTVTGVSRKLDQLIAEQKAANKDIFRDAINVSYAITKKLFPSLNEQQKLVETETLLQKTLPQVLEEPRVTIEVHPDMEAPLNERLADISAETHYEGKLLINASTSITDGDCKIEWSNGGAERDLQALISEADKIIESNLSSLEGEYVPSPDAYQEDQTENLTENSQPSGESEPTANDAPAASDAQMAENAATDTSSVPSASPRDDGDTTSGDGDAAISDSSQETNESARISAENDPQENTENAPVKDAQAPDTPATEPAG